MSFLTKEKLAIREAIHAMKWLDKHYKGWGLEEECAILQNLCGNQEEKEIQSNHSYLDLQYQLDDAIKENEQLQTLRSDIITAINRPQTITDKGLLMYIRDEVDVNMRQAAKIQELETDMKQSERVIEAKLDVIDQQAARIKELETQINNWNRNC